MAQMSRNKLKWNNRRHKVGRQLSSGKLLEINGEISVPNWT